MLFAVYLFRPYIISLLFLSVFHDSALYVPHKLCFYINRVVFLKAVLVSPPDRNAMSTLEIHRGTVHIDCDYSL